MEEALRSLAALALKAIPTFLLVVLLHFYLKWVYFRPMRRTLDERNAATEGARRLAEDSLARAAEKAEQYDQSLREARAKMYREQEELREQLRAEQARSIEEARRKAAEMVKEAQRQIGAELESAKEVLHRDADALAEDIVRTMLRRRAA